MARFVAMSCKIISSGVATQPLILLGRSDATLNKTGANLYKWYRRAAAVKDTQLKHCKFTNQLKSHEIQQRKINRKNP